MKSFKALAASLALVIGASGAALAQPWQPQNKARQETHRTINLPAQNYEAMQFGNRYGRAVVTDRRGSDRDDVRRDGYYTNGQVRERGHDNDDAWQYRSAESGRHRVIGPEVRVRESGSGHSQLRVDKDHDRF